MAKETNRNGGGIPGEGIGEGEQEELAAAGPRFETTKPAQRTLGREVQFINPKGADAVPVKLTLRDGGNVERSVVVRPGERIGVPAEYADLVPLMAPQLKRVEG